MIKLIKLGLIGTSEGNGHPYSWSAIFNGYSHKKMENCGFPVIPRYLEKQPWPSSKIEIATVSCIWTQEESISRKIADTVYIDKVCESLQEMAKEVDGVLLARDDSENHFIHAVPFLEKGIPIYIDKPLSTEVINAKRILSKQCWNGQVFSCSAMRYDKDINISQYLETQKVVKIIAKTPRSWEKYAIHCIDPIISSCSGELEVLSSKRHQVDDVISTNFYCKHKDRNIYIEVSACGDQQIPISFMLFSEYDDPICQLYHKDTFNSFRNALKIFVSETCLQKKSAISVDQMLKSVEMIERGLS